ncbi:23S rRNA (guanosine(2251)-2'-O)-methyltransferase RlmB [Campylobacter concisus]|jgi:RNA methyltransferase, trmH family, group 3|uniref:rRNA methyltransferase, TrmH family, group 3 n=1 Tax=Campylobacter concisus TaxID=199 RepID=A0A0M4SG94_9BACT|nr:23S rRNA (guanosine(2251)-2'-O)-methyltransferase RlmB [Campylobacter concisus]ALF46965.1 rRNA methyltransferase, TrmH family, group 3 [Campylobacter concisus]MBE9828172.1 23S rRNA (guanosine(2251)-2'-O)-methyltransferase RlmB [Campylobacter concisus]ORI09586.1 23S rRNA (guanosine(2251)-2'-O)-methyltransferase RlmB [Campylobacter concisus]OUT15562.1 23S rRNA (guanosine(2251)-2'-O)-methyltransferase RlmB [Campylobacter concisus]QPH98809.1 23S rRNA (guanosine(2251)-2'-O)-methyltransferase Rlm
MIIYGKQLFLHILNKRPQILEEIYLSKECDKKLFSKICGTGKKIIRVDNQKAQSLARGGNHQGFLANVSEFEFSDIAELKKLNFIAILYGISDVGNIGAIARSAYALGCEGLVIVAKSINMQGVLRSSSGAAYEIPIAIFEDGLSLLNELKQFGFKIYATASNGKNVKEMKFAGKRALVMGSEGEGIPQKALAKCDECIGIKLKEGWDSLNVSAAFAIICDRMIDE